MRRFMNPDKAVVVIATYNEADTIGPILDALSDYRVIVVDDNSPDGTAQIAQRRRNSSVVIRKFITGVASAYLHGFDIALCGQYDYVVQMDAGETHDPLTVPHLIGCLSDADLAIGSRFVTRPPLLSYRTVISLGATALMRSKGVYVRDATSGFRAWRSDTLRDAMACVTASGFAFQLELLWNVHKAGARIFELPIPYRLTNSSFRPWMLAEALDVWRKLA
jgi:dolichol-phosphate mannosyltransferase